MILFEASYLQDTAHHHKGALGQAQLSYIQPFSTRLIGQIETSASWMDDNYAQSFFGITAQQSAVSGLRIYSAESSVKDATISVLLHYIFSKHWRITTGFAYKQLLGDTRNSPLVKDAGSERQPSVVMTFNYQL